MRIRQNHLSPSLSRKPTSKQKLMIKTLTLTLLTAIAPAIAFGQNESSPSKGYVPSEDPSGCEAMQTETQAKALEDLLPSRDYSFFGTQNLVAAPKSDKSPSIAASPSMKMPGSDVQLNGMMIANSTWKNNYAMGLYHIPVTQEGEFTLIGRTSMKEIKAGYVSGTRYIGTELRTSASSVSASILAFDMSTWKYTSVVTGLERAMTKCCKDPSTGTVYAITFNASGDGFEWAIIDLESGYRKKIADIENLAYIACDWSGQFYYMKADGEFGKLDKSTAVLTKIADTGLTASFAGGACVNDANSTMLVSLYPETGAYLYEIDLSTGVPLKVLDFADNAEITNMFIANPPVGAYPSKPELSISAPEGSLTVNYSFNMPSTLGDGTAVTEPMQWTIYGNGETLFSGTAAPGEKVEGSYNATEAGYVKYTTTVSNSAGHSPADEWYAYVGKGAPGSPRNGKLVVADGKFTVTWDAPRESDGDGGYIDYDKLTYTIKDQDGKVMSENAVSPFVMDIPDVKDYKVYKFSIYAVNDYRTSKANVTNGYGMGEFHAPMEFQFRTNGNIDGFTVIDCNEDGSVWQEWNYNACYKYNKENKADDWLISPDIRLEANTTYIFTCSAKTQGSTDYERLEVKAGRGKTVADMTMDLIPETELTSTQYVTLQGLLTTTEAGYYNVGFHALSEPNKWFLSVEGFTLNEGTSNVAPKAISGVSFTSDPDGAYKTTIGWDVPSEFLDGSAIGGNVDTEIYRDGELVTTVSGAPGDKATYVDEVESEGTYSYSLFPVYKGAKGIGTIYNVFVGRKAPSRPETVLMTETAPGEVTITWDAVTTDIDGDPVNPANISYTISRRNASGDWEPLFTDLKETSKSFVAVEGGQRFEVFSVNASNIDRPGEGRTTQFRPLGTAYQVPVKISDKKDLESYILGYSTAGGLEWRTVDDKQFGTIQSQDHDDTFFSAANPGTTSGLYGSLFTGKISLENVKNPTLTFYTYIIDNATVLDENTVTVSVIDAEGIAHKVEVVDHASLKDYAGSWYKSFVDLSAYKGQTVQVDLMATSVSMIFTHFDNINIFDALDNDLELTDLTAPETVDVDSPYQVDLIVTNEGKQDTGAFEVALSCNGEVVKNFHCDGLKRGQRTQFVHEDSFSRAQNPKRVYSATVLYNPDENPDNDQSAEAVVERVLNEYPRVEGLKGNIVDAGISLTWDESSFVAADIQTEDFEGAESFAHEVKGWTMVDVDDQPICGITTSYSIPGTVMGRTHASFIVYDNSDETDWKDLFASHSGNKFLVSAGQYYSDRGPSDDWAISPILSGEEQTVTFYARCFDNKWADYIEVYACSSLSTDPSDGYVKVMEATRLKSTWERYSVKLPAGTNYFAIRSTSDSGFLAMIDDVTYRSAGLELEGYNVYHNGEKLNDEPVAKAEYVHEFDHDDATHTYHVTAIYRHGARPGMESEVSDPVELTTSGVVEVTTAGVVVAAEGHDIVVRGAEGVDVAVTASDGRVLLRTVGDIRHNVVSGLYLVTVGRKTVKIIVK